MFVRPSLVGSLGRSNWKSIKESPYFVLQQRGNNAPTQQNNKRRHYTEYRIITKGFPHYRGKNGGTKGVEVHLHNDNTYYIIVFF